MCRAIPTCTVTSLHRHETCDMCSATFFVDYCNDGLDRCANCGMDLCDECLDTACDETPTGNGEHVMRSEVGPDDCDGEPAMVSRELVPGYGRV